MQVRPIPAVITGNWSAVIITSANAPRALSAAQLAPLLKLPLYAVGERSADAAHDAGFREVRSAKGGAEALIRLIAEGHGGERDPLIYLAGVDRAANIEGVLAGKGIKVTTVEVYRVVTSGFPPELVAAVEQNKLDAVLHFSRRSAESFVAGAKAAGLIAPALALKHLCLSAQVAEPLIAADASNVTIANNPNEAALLALLPS
jgi:uroporphyrinogen-III synthase